MKILSCAISLFAVLLASNASAQYSDKKFQGEVLTGLDIITIPEIINGPEPAPGELGFAVYETVGAVNPDDMKLYIPTSMYVRMGGGLNLGFATDSADYFGTTHKSKASSYTTQIGLGWNLSSYVRTEIDFQHTTLKFQDIPNQSANYDTIGGTLYFDFARRYVQTGDITTRRTFVPFMGLGVAFGAYDFQGASGADGAIIAAPRATLGLNIALTDLIGIDIAYQYQMMIGNGFGWDAQNGGVNSISNVIASIRANF